MLILKSAVSMNEWYCYNHYSARGLRKHQKKRAFSLPKTAQNDFFLISKALFLIGFLLLFVGFGKFLGLRFSFFLEFPKNGRSNGSSSCATREEEEREIKLLVYKISYVVHSSRSHDIPVDFTMEGR